MEINDLAEIYSQGNCRLSELMNMALTDSDPFDRILLAQALSSAFGGLLMLNSAALEQLLAKLESENAAQVATTMLRVFLKVRPAIAEELKSIAPIPD